MYLCNPYFQIYSLKHLGQSTPNFMWILLWKVKRKYMSVVKVIWPRWPLWPYMVKTFENLLLQNNCPMIMKLCMYSSSTILRLYKCWNIGEKVLKVGPDIRWAFTGPLVLWYNASNIYNGRIKINVLWIHPVPLCIEYLLYVLIFIQTTVWIWSGSLLWLHTHYYFSTLIWCVGSRDPTHQIKILK